MAASKPSLNCLIDATTAFAVVESVINLLLNKPIDILDPPNFLESTIHLFRRQIAIVALEKWQKKLL